MIIIETKILLPKAEVTITDCVDPVYAFGLLTPKAFKIIRLSNLLTLSVVRTKFDIYICINLRIST